MPGGYRHPARDERCRIRTLKANGLSNRKIARSSAGNGDGGPAAGRRPGRRPRSAARPLRRSRARWAPSRSPSASAERARRPRSGRRPLPAFAPPRQEDELEGRPPLRARPDSESHGHLRAPGDNFPVAREPGLLRGGRFRLRRRRRNCGLMAPTEIQANSSSARQAATGIFHRSGMEVGCVEIQRTRYRATLDAPYFHPYGSTDRDDVHYIYLTFPIAECREIESWGGYLTRDLCLAWTNAHDGDQPDADFRPPSYDRR